MFCKFCGQNIPDTAEFCPECGKKLKKEETHELEAHRVMSTPLALMLIMLCWNTVFAWGQTLLFGYRAHISMLISTVMLVVGLVLLGTLIGRERIHAETYRFSDLLVLCCVWMVVPTLLFRLEVEFVLRFVRIVAYWNMIDVIKCSAFWLVMGLIALGLARSGNWKPTKKQKIILLAVLVLRPVFGFVFAPQLALWTNTPSEVFAMAVRATRLSSVLCWLWPLLILRVFRRLGSGEIGPAGAAAALVGMQLGEFLLLPVFVFLMDLDQVGLALAEGLAPLFGLLILHLATRLHKKRSVEVK